MCWIMLVEKLLSKEVYHFLFKIMTPLSQNTPSGQLQRTSLSAPTYWNTLNLNASRRYLMTSGGLLNNSCSLTSLAGQPLNFYLMGAMLTSFKSRLTGG